MTPDGPAILGRTRYDNLFLDCGHGSNGWTQACGTGKIVADIVAGRPPEVDMEGLTAGATRHDPVRRCVGKSRKGHGPDRHQDSRAAAKDATCSVAEIAEQVNLSVTPCWRRIQKLKDDGVIARNTILLDPKALGLNLTVFVSIKTSQHNAKWTQSLINAVMALPNVVEFHRMAGDIDYLLKVVVGTWPPTTASIAASSTRWTCWT